MEIFACILILVDANLFRSDKEFISSDTSKAELHEIGVKEKSLNLGVNSL
jgi:hypothetical protein